MPRNPNLANLLSEDVLPDEEEEEVRCLGRSQSSSAVGAAQERKQKRKGRPIIVRTWEWGVVDSRIEKILEQNKFLLFTLRRTKKPAN